MSMWRSHLFVPAKQRSTIKKAVVSEADCVILDLEDAVAISEKESARELVKESLAEFKDEKPIYVRMNDTSTTYWEEDLSALVSSGAKGVIVPMSQGGEEMRLVCDRVRHILKEVGREEDEAQFEVIPLVETAKGVQFAYEIASADPMITNLSFGAIDFSLDVGCELTSGGEELKYARSKIVIASKAAEIGSPIDSVYPDLNRPDVLEYEAKFSKQLGFKGKLVIHPKQLDIVHDVFSISEEELEEARKIVAEFEKAEKEGSASITVNDSLVDYPVYKKAKAILTISEKQGHR